MISLLVPTRARPDAARAMWASARDTADQPDALELVLRVDDDDPTASQLAALPGTVEALGGPRILLSDCWNEAASVAVGDLLWHGADDVRFRTRGWDTAVREAFERYPDRIVFVHGRDGFQDAGLGTHGWLHRRWVDTAGFFVPPYFSSDYNDTWVTDIADQLGRRVYLPEVYTEHLHPVAGKGEWDQTHRERLERGVQDNVGARYESLADERRAWADKLREAMA